MTVQEAILSRSQLPKDGTYTMYDHIFSLEMNVTGSVGVIGITPVVDTISVVVSKADIKVKEAIISVVIDSRTNDVQVDNNVVDIRIV